jgi:hypothetical protein
VAGREIKLHAEIGGQGHFGQRRGETARGNVVAGRDLARCGWRSGRNRRCGALPSGRPLAARLRHGRGNHASRPLWPRWLQSPPIRITALPALAPPIRAMCASCRSGRRRRWWAWAGSPRHWSRCRARHCPRRSGNRAPAGFADALDAAMTSWPMISGRSGLPKLRLSVEASGSAPTAVRLRQHFGDRLLAAFKGISLDIARA